MKDNPIIQLKCQECGHTWITRSKLRKVTCPSCQFKVKNKEAKK